MSAPCQRGPQLYQQNNTDITYWKSQTSHNLWFIPSTCTTVHGGRRRIFWWRGPRDIVYRVNMGGILPIRTVNGKFFCEFRAHAPPGKFLRLNFSEMQSSAFWTLKFSKCPDSILNMKCWNIILINHKRGGGRPLGPFLNLPLVQCTCTDWEQLSLVLVNNRTNSCWCSLYYCTRHTSRIIKIFWTTTWCTGVQ